jgi:hypothetical protein
VAIVSIDFGGPWLARIADREDARRLTMPDEPYLQRNPRAPDFGVVVFRGSRELNRDAIARSMYACLALDRLCRAQLFDWIVDVGGVPAPLDFWTAKEVKKFVLGETLTFFPRVPPSSQSYPFFAMIFGTFPPDALGTVREEGRATYRQSDFDPTVSRQFAGMTTEELSRVWPDCENADRLLRIGLAHRMDGVKNRHRLNVARQGPQDHPHLSWRVRLLPLLGHDELYQRFHHDEPWDSPHNKRLIAEMPECYLAPGRQNNGTTTYQAVAGPGTVFGTPSDPLRSYPAIDSATIALVEVTADGAVPWTAPRDWQFNPDDPTSGLKIDDQTKTFRASTYSLSRTARTVRADLDLETLRRLFAPRDGVRVDPKKVFAN